MNIQEIKSDQELREALKSLEKVFDAKIGTKESDEADLLVSVIGDYEDKFHPIE